MPVQHCVFVCFWPYPYRWYTTHLHITVYYNCAFFLYIYIRTSDSKASTVAYLLQTKSIVFWMTMFGFRFDFVCGHTYSVAQRRISQEYDWMKSLYDYIKMICAYKTIKVCNVQMYTNQYIYLFSLTGRTLQVFLFSSSILDIYYITFFVLKILIIIIIV